jgi:hypothetical protein
LRLIETGVGTAGKLRGNIPGLARDCERSSHRIPSVAASRTKTKPGAKREDVLVALAGRHVHWTSLAVQQQRFQKVSNAD